jgi:hypothetical protein
MAWEKKHIFGLIVAPLGALAIMSPARADLVAALLPTQWNSISNASPANSDGEGYHAFAGGGHETLLQFDFSSIPANATITSATLTMYMDRSPTSNPASQPVFVYRLTDSWGMGTSGLGQVDNGITGGGGMGYTATNNDAIWNDRFYNASNPSASTPWTTAGGDYVSTPSANALVGSGSATTGQQGVGGPLLSTWSGSGLASDVQAWLNGSNPNDGWILNDFATAANYPPSGSTFGSIQPRRFITPSNNLNGAGGTSDDRPYLTITYSVPEPAVLGITGMAGAVSLLRRRRRD